MSHVPIVEIALKITEISEINPETLRYTLKGILMLNWRDPSLAIWTLDQIHEIRKSSAKFGIPLRMLKVSKTTRG